MTWLFSVGLHNVAVATLLALLVWGIARIWKNPPAAHLLWLLVLVKLVTPPIVNVDLGKWGVGHDAQARHSADSRATVEGQLPLTPLGSDMLSHSALDERTHSIKDDGSDAVLPAQPRITVAAAWSAVRPVLIWIWVGGIVLVALVAVARIVRFQRMLAGTLPASDRLQSVANEQTERLGLRRSPDIRVADSAVAPLVWCLGGRATVILPLKLLGVLDEQQTAMVLAHELAHLHRRDHWVRVLELAVSVLYWWNPLVWWVRRQLHAAEEQCCDAWVAWVYPGRSRDYAESLLKAAELLPAQPPLAALTSPFLNTHSLQERIELVLTSRSQRTASRAGAVALALLAAVVIPAGIRGAVKARDEQTQAAPSKAADDPTKVKPVENPKPDQPTADQKKPLAKELQLLQGTFKAGRLWRSDKWPAKPEEFHSWQWMIKGEEIVWSRPNQEEIRLSFTVDATKSLPRIDLTFLNGPDKGERCQGVYLASRHEIQICFQDPGAKVERPTNIGSKPGSQLTSMALVPTETLPVADEVAALQGVWKFEIYYSDWWPERISDPPISWSRWRWTVTGNEIRWTGMKVPDVKLSFTLDPSKSPRQIDLTFLDGPHKGKKLLGMYEFFAEDGCHICFADPEAKIDRPTKNEYSTGLGQTMVSIDRVPPEEPAADAPPRKETAADRGPEIDAAIGRLRKQGAFVREFSPRGDPEHWVQIISYKFDDADLADVEIIGRGVGLDLHLRDTSVTSAGLERLISVGRFANLNLGGRDVDDALLTILPKLPLQGHLGLSAERLTNAGIQPVSECRQLTAISLGGNLSNDSLEHLTGLPKLQAVSLGKHFTRGAFDTLERLEGLTDLDASELNPDLNDLTKVPKLRRLSLLGQKYDDKAALTIADTFKSLEEAYLRNTSITNAGVQHLSRLEKLKILTLDDSLVDDGMADSIRKMKQLTWLSMGDCAVGDDTLAALSECPEMWYVFLDHTRVTDKGLAHLPKLKRPLALYLSECKSVTDAGMKSLSQLPDSPNLHIELTRTGVTEDGVHELKAALPHAQISWGTPAVPLK